MTTRLERSQGRSFFEAVDIAAFVGLVICVCAYGSGYVGWSAYIVVWPVAEGCSLLTDYTTA